MTDREMLINLLYASMDQLPYGSGKTYGEAVADYMIANGVTVQKWIPVTERLPDTAEHIWKDADGSEGSYKISEWVLGIDENGVQVVARYETGPVFHGWYDRAFTDYAITRWMPLPPKEGEH